MSGHALGFVPEVNAVRMVESNLVVFQKIVAVLVADRDAKPTIVLQNVLLKQPVPNTPAEVESVLAVAAGDTPADHRPLRAAPGMEAQPGVVLAHAVLHQHIVGLLETDAVAVVVPHHAILDHRAKAAIEKNAAATAAVEIDILLLVPLDDEVLHARAFEVVAADNREDGRGLGLVCDHAIGVQRLVDGKGVSISPGDARHRYVKAAGVAVPDSDASADLEAVRVRDRDLLLAVISIQRQR